METTLNKAVSMRCDMHPPLSAPMYCDKCQAFLCKICAEVRTTGRVCVKCKGPCRQPSAEEYPELVERRKKVHENSKLAQQAVEQLKRANERAKVDRDARLKAEFAAKKAEWQQRESIRQATGANPLPQIATPMGANEESEPRAQFAPVQPLPQGPSKFEDPLYKLGERGHLNVIGRAKKKILFVAILTMLFNGVAYLFVAGASAVADTLSDAHAAAVARREEHPKSGPKLSAEQREKLRVEQETTDAMEQHTFEKARSTFFWFKLVLFGFFCVGAGMFVLYFMAETKPKEATAWAFYLYVAATGTGVLIDLVISGSVSPVIIAVRGLMAYALYTGMVAGAELQAMRDEEAQWLAAKGARA